VDAAQEILDLTGLTSFADARADSLPIGLQRRLEIARALATGPSLLLLDEPAAGLVSQEADELADLIRVIHGEGKSIVKSIVVIEHNMTFAMGLCQRIIALDQGQVIAEGEPAAVRADEQVINVYLGRRRNHA
jgi:ABC-type branched-subunit amino acid transport system ATPase component